MANLRKEVAPLPNLHVEVSRCLKRSRDRCRAQRQCRRKGKNPNRSVWRKELQIVSTICNSYVEPTSRKDVRYLRYLYHVFMVRVAIHIRTATRQLLRCEYLLYRALEGYRMEYSENTPHTWRHPSYVPTRVGPDKVIGTRKALKSSEPVVM